MFLPCLPLLYHLHFLFPNTIYNITLMPSVSTLHEEYFVVPSTRHTFTPAKTTTVNWWSVPLFIEKAILLTVLTRVWHSWLRFSVCIVTENFTAPSLDTNLICILVVLLLKKGGKRFLSVELSRDFSLQKSTLPPLLDHEMIPQPQWTTTQSSGDFSTDFTCQIKVWPNRSP